MRAAALAGLLLLSGSPANGGDSARWLHYASDLASSRYTEAPDLDAESFGRLRVRWAWESPDVAWLRDVFPGLPRKRTTPAPRLGYFQVTPVHADGLLFGLTSMGIVFAVDPGSGETRWTHDPGSYRNEAGRYRWVPVPRHRGVALHRGKGGLHVVVATVDARLLLLDAATGAPVSSFGKAGRVDLMRGLRRPGRRLRDYFQSSPPLVVGDVIVVGSAISDRPNTPDGIPGDVRGYDANTGSLLWTFHTIPRTGESGAESWQDGSHARSGGANVWGPMSADAEQGIVYFATSTPTNDFYGGHRPGDNLFAESVVAVDARTGRRRWHYQLIRHGLWDYDVPAAPNLLELQVGDRSVPALAQVTKQGFVFVFDRLTGKPVWPIEDRPVPASDVPGERSAATQPFPTRPPPFELQGAFERDLADYTPVLHAAAKRVFQRYRGGPVFTPPSVEGTLTIPGPPGGASWAGAGVDPASGFLYVPSITSPKVVAVEPGRKQKRELDWVRSPKGLSFGSAEGFEVEFREGRLPLMKGPMSRVTAYDLNRGEIAWQVPLGRGAERHPELRDLGLAPLGTGARSCVLVTKHLVIAGDGGDVFRPEAGDRLLLGLDRQTGATIGEIHLPGKAMGCPMAIQTKKGTTIVVAVADPQGDGSPSLVALRLP